jgi:hypothetical protein
LEPAEVVIVWGAAGDERATFNAANPEIELRTAEAYQRVAKSDRHLRAAYEVGESLPGPWVADRVVVPVGAGCWDAPPAWAGAALVRRKGSRP